MRQFLVILFLLCITLCISAQDVVSPDRVANTAQQESTKNDVVFVAVECMPEFPGGQSAMMKFIAENIQYPVIAQELGIQGRAICQFVIEKDGSVTEATLARSTGDAALDREALRIIGSMPTWKPGMQKGKPVRVKYTLPINFRLSPAKSNNNPTSSAHSSSSSSKGQNYIDRTVPQFPGGLTKLNEYVKANIRYPKAAYDRGIRGKTLLELQVEEDGTISEVKVLKSATFKSLDDEAIRLVRSMPKWLPALKDGKPVVMKTTLPLGFGMQ